MEIALAIVKPNAIDHLVDIAQCIHVRGFSILKVRYGTSSGYGCKDIEQCVCDRGFPIFEVRYGTSSG